jgi:fibro-slime domain-containing protein
MSRFTWLAAAGFALIGSLGSLHADIMLTGTVRDFHMFPYAVANGLPANPDFENAISDDRGIVQSMLGADGTPVYGDHPSGTATTFGYNGNSAEYYFNQWYHDTPGYNTPLSYTIDLAPIGGGLYQYSNFAFFPIDGQGFGNEGQGHNFSFTYQIDTTFGYTGSGTFTFSGDDDVFVFINKTLAIDLGGVHGNEFGSVDLTTLGLTVGKNYSLDVFFNERHTTGSDFTMTTDLNLEQQPSVPEPASMALFASGAVGLMAYGWRKRRSGASAA